MVLLTTYTAALFVAILSRALASPIANEPSPENPIIDNSVGFDENYKSRTSLSARDDAILPEILRWSADQFGNDTSDTSSPHEPTSSKVKRLARRFIFGSSDNREYWNMDVYPFISVGRLMWDSGVFCSGALVGPRHVLTARHCLPDDPIHGTFSPGYDNGDRFGSGQVVAALTSEGEKKGSPCETKQDWAILVLDQKLGDKVGYFGVKNPDSSLFEEPIFYHMGYPGDLSGGSRPYRMMDNKVLSKNSLSCDPTGPIYTDTDTAGGQSGGPFWEYDKDGNRWIWGALSIGVTWGKGLGYSGFASGAQMIDAINKLRKAYP